MKLTLDCDQFVTRFIQSSLLLILGFHQTQLMPTMKA